MSDLSIRGYSAAIEVPPFDSTRASLGRSFWQVRRLLFSFEFVFALFLYSSLYKSAPLLAWIPIDLTLAFATIALAGGSVILLRSRGITSRRAVLACASCIAFTSFATGSVLWSPTGGVGLERAFIGMPLVTLAFVVPALVIARQDVRVHRFLSSQLCVCYYVLLMTFVAWAHNGVAGVAALGTLGAGDSIARGVALATGAVILYARAIASVRSFAKTLGYVVLIAALFVGILVGGSRQALIGSTLVMLGSSVALIGYRRGRGVVVSWRIWPLAFLCLIGTVGIVYAGRAGVSLTTIQRFELLLSGERGESVNVRAEYRHRALSAFREAPTFGHGIGSFGVLEGNERNAHPHNLIAELLFELGIAGTGLFVVLLVCSIRFGALWRLKRRDASAHAILFALIVLMVSSMASNTFAESRTLFAFLGLATYRPTLGFYRWPA